MKIHGGHQFLVDNGSDLSRSQEVLQRIRKKARDAGAGELVICLGIYGMERVR